MRDPDTIVIARDIAEAKRASWLGHTERHVITPRSTVRLRGRTIRRVLVIGYRRDDPDLTKVMDEVMPCTLRHGDPIITYH